MGTESETVEFKKSTGELKQGVISLASMLNKTGHGELYFGVRNDGTAIGQQIGEGTLRDISRAIADAIKPPVVPSIGTLWMDGINVIKVTADGTQFPYSAYGRYYIRSADEDREMSPHELQSAVLGTQNSISVMKSLHQELSFFQIKSLYAARHLLIADDVFESNLHLLTPDGSYNLMADILSDYNSYSIKVAVFRGTDKLHLIRRNEFGEQCLLLAINQVLQYAQVFNDTAVDLSGGVREDYPAFDFNCFREAWLNACLHNQWARQIPPAVYIYSDRIEIVSAGGLPRGLSLERFYRGESVPVNLDLQRIMLQLGFVEQTGHGVPLIVSRYGREAFDISDDFITVTIPFYKQEHNSVNRPLSYKVGPDTTEQILQIMRDDSTVTVSKLGEMLGIGTTSVTNCIRKLKQDGILSRSGAKKNGHWVVAANRG